MSYQRRTAYLFNFHFDSYFGGHPVVQQSGNLHLIRFAEYIHRRITSAISFLDQNELVFEAGEAEEIAGLFQKFAQNTDATPEEFLLIWEEFCQWGDTSVNLSGREKTLVRIPPLPQLYAW